MSGNVSPKTAIRRGTSLWQHFYVKKGSTQGAVPTEALCELSIYQKAQGFSGKSNQLCFPKDSVQKWSPSGRPEIPGTSGNKGQCSVAHGRIPAGMGFLQGLALTSHMQKAWLLPPTPECKQVYKTRTGQLIFYSLNFPWEAN